jgi:hypothetical protein
MVSSQNSHINFYFQGHIPLAKDQRQTPAGETEANLGLRRDRQVLSLDEFTDEDLAAIAQSWVPAEYASLNRELIYDKL